MVHDGTANFIYRIEVEGRVSPEWSEWLNGLSIKLLNEQPPLTELRGVLVDQARLRGILNKLWDLNLAVISLERLEPNGG
jgi:hypothetical protein